CPELAPLAVPVQASDPGEEEGKPVEGERGGEGATDPAAEDDKEADGEGSQADDRTGPSAWPEGRRRNSPSHRPPRLGLRTGGGLAGGPTPWWIGRVARPSPGGGPRAPPAARSSHRSANRAGALLLALSCSVTRRNGLHCAALTDGCQEGQG